MAVSAGLFHFFMFYLPLWYLYECMALPLSYPVQFGVQLD